MGNLSEIVEKEVRKSSFSGVVEVSSPECSFKKAWGYRNRAKDLKNNLNTRFGVASGTKGFTALGIACLMEEGEINLDTKALSIIGDRFQELHPEITIEQLLAHTSGIGDHYDEDMIQDSVDDFFLSIPVQKLVSPFDYIPLIKSRDQKFSPGTQACYSNGGYVVLAMIIESISKIPFQQFIQEKVFNRAGMNHSGFFRSDDLPENTALGYLIGKERDKTNELNLPVIGSGDGGAYSNLEDMSLFWESLLTNQIVSESMLKPMIEKQNKLGNADYGHGFWIGGEGSYVALEGYDAGVSFFSTSSKDLQTQVTIISNDRSGVWPILKSIKQEMF